MRKDLKIVPAIFPMPVLMIATYNEDGSVDVMNAAWGTAYDPFTHGYYEVTKKVGQAFSDGKELM